MILSILFIILNFFIISCPPGDDDDDYTPTSTPTPSNSAVIQCFFDPTDVIPVWEVDKWVWYFSFTIQETNGFSATIQTWYKTLYDEYGNQLGDVTDWSQYISAAFGTNQLSANGELTSSSYIYRGDHTDTPMSEKYSFGGTDENGNSVDCECIVNYLGSSGACKLSRESSPKAPVKAGKE